MAKTDQYTAQQMIDALRATKGMKTLAAKRLGCAYTTIQRYIENYPTVKAAFEEAQESIGDSVETTLLNQALGVRGNDGKWIQEPNVTALIFLAKTHPALRSRGYGAKQYNEQEGAMQIEVVYTRRNRKTGQSLDDE